jgi:3-hydroxyisobutyrate dehydrogenase-like beta-hydroxyacid dehydrogenase
VEDLVHRGAPQAQSLQHIAGQGVELVFLCLPNSDVVEVVVGQLAAQLRAGTIIVDSTTSHPDSTRMLHRQLAQQAIEFVDAPITGGPKHAEKGELTVLVGAEQAVFTTIEPLLQTFAKTVLHMGCRERATRPSFSTTRLPTRLQPCWLRFIRLRANTVSIGASCIRL